MNRYFIFLSLILSIFCSCSTDDNPSPPDEVNGTMQGAFIDSPVEGLKYETETHSGFTDENGNYDYEEGETVTFYVGDITLGSAVATGELSPIDIATTPNADIETLEVQNIAAFLQTLDEDGDPENGIKISSEVAAAISLSEIDFSAPIIQILGEIVIEVFQETGKNLTVVFPEMAAIHLAQTLGIDFEPEASFSFNFLPTFTNYYGSGSSAVNWVHEFDEEGRPSRSIKYEKYPFRILNEFVFSNYQDGKVSFEITSYSYERVSDPVKREHIVFYDGEFFIEKFENLYTGYNPTPFTVINQLTAEKYISIIENQDPNGVLVSSENFEYNDDGLIIRKLSYNSEGNLSAEVVLTYTDFGGVKSRISNKPDGTYFKFNYYYREDNTLEKLEWEVKQSYAETLVIQEFNENENLIRDTTTQNFEDGRTQITIESFEAGILISIELIDNGIKKQYNVYEPDGNGGSYLSTMEIYDENGNLISKSCFNIEGNEIECES